MTTLLSPEAEDNMRCVTPADSVNMLHYTALFSNLSFMRLKAHNSDILLQIEKCCGVLAGFAIL